MIDQKLDKLLALVTRNDSGPEAKSALLKAQAHYLTQNPVVPGTAPRVHQLVEEDQGVWLQVLMQVVGTNFRTQPYRSVEARALGLAGAQEDVAVARRAIQATADCAWFLAWRWSKRQKETPTYAVQMDYMYGFIDGLRTAFEAQVQERRLHIQVPVLSGLRLEARDPIIVTHMLEDAVLEGKLAK